MILDSIKDNIAEKLDCDICIVGSGAAGLSIASEFINTKASILILEGGGIKADGDSQVLYSGDVYGDVFPPNNGYLGYSRLRYFAGSTNHWSGWCRPFDAIDFEKRDYIPHSGWPVTAQEMSGYYERAATILGVKDVVQTDALRKNIDQELLFNRRSTELKECFFHISPRTIQSSDRDQMFSSIYKKLLSQHKSITAITNSNLVEINLKDNNQQVENLQFKKPNQKKFSVKAKCYVLACGGIENPRLLLASNRQLKAGVGNQNDLVGRFFMEHPMLDAAQFLQHYNGQPLSYYDKTIDVITNQRQIAVIAWKEEFQREKKLAQFCAEILYDRKKQLFIGSPSIIKQAAKTAFMFDNGSLTKDYQHPTVFPIRIRTEQAPNPDSRLTLSTERDSIGLPKVHLNWKISEIDRLTFKHALKSLAANFGAAAIGRLQISFDEIGPAFPVQASCHHMGTTRMHQDAKLGVVDSNCLIHGMQDLYIAGSSIFPTTGFASPTYSIVAFAVRLADHLKEKIRV